MTGAWAHVAVALLIVVLPFPTSNAFVFQRAPRHRTCIPRSPQRSPFEAALLVKLQAFASSTADQARRQVLLSRNGPHFKLDRRTGKIEFGATANLVTKLTASTPTSAGISSSSSDSSLVAAWLRDERGLAMSIWDPKLIQERGNSVYRLQIMTLQFVTLALAPWVDVQMKTVEDPSTGKSPTTGDDGDTASLYSQPVFTLQSVGFDPNLQILPGVRIDANAMGIVIEVAGSLRPVESEIGIVAGGIAFQTTGILPLPMRLLPEAVLKATSDTINKTVVNFAVQSFQKGAKTNFNQFLLKRQQQQQQ